MPRKPKQLTKPERRLTAIQRGVLEAIDERTSLADFSDRTIDALIARKLVDRVGRKSKGYGGYVLTPFGRSALAYNAQHTGRATR